MKKKLLFVNNNLHSGGIQRSLLNLLHNIENEYDITLLLMYPEGEYKEQLPKNITVLRSPPLLRILGMSQKEVLHENKLLFLWRSFFAVLCRWFGNSVPLRILAHFQPKLSGYDAAISYMQSEAPKLLYGGTNEIVLKRVDAKEKITVVHSDFLNCGSNIPAIRKLYQRFDKVISCSSGCRERFIQANPSLKDRTYVVNNFNEYDKIVQLGSQEPITYSKDQINLVTVARLGEEKGIERALLAVQNCLKSGIPILYHIIGDGMQRIPLQEMCRQLEISEQVFFYGTKKNPYRYIKNADLFFLTSYHEAAPIVFSESKCLGVPILATQTTSVKEMILDDDAGWVCENNAEDICRMLKEVCSNPEVLREKKQLLAGRTYTNACSQAQWRHALGED